MEIRGIAHLEPVLGKNQGPGVVTQRNIGGFHSQTKRKIDNLRSSLIEV
jgi:hypothetical protein